MFPSVAPDVNVISEGLTFINSAIIFLAFLILFDTANAPSYKAEGFIQSFFIISSDNFITLSLGFVVAALSR